MPLKRRALINAQMCHTKTRKSAPKHLVGVLGNTSCWSPGPGCTRVDTVASIQWINPFPVDKIGAFLILIGWANFIHWIGIYPLDKVIHSSYNWAQWNTPNYLLRKNYKRHKISNCFCFLIGQNFVINRQAGPLMRWKIGNYAAIQGSLCGKLCGFLILVL